VVWRASYQPDGAAEVRQWGQEQPWSLELRWPGQYHDTESGLHYHRQRYHDPTLGQFLTPDPLGLPDGPNPYAYVAHNPWRFVDPDGLLLFAFDGTGNDESRPNELSYVVNFKELYRDGETFYITGPGTLDPRTGIVNPWYKGGNALDAALSLTGKQRVQRLLADLAQQADNTDDLTTLQVDVVGFSRGAAEARDFVNEVADALNGDWFSYTNQALVRRCQKLNLRFVGLWDTVLSTHSGDYRLAIPSAVDHAAHALALNEYRALFPAESILDGPFSAWPVAGQQRVEQGLLGSHSDVGGSFPDGELAQAALAWMVEQALAAGVRMDTRQLDTLSRTALHDKSSNLTSSAGPAPNASSEDRVLRYQGGRSIRQRLASVPGMSHDDTLAFIDYEPAPRSAVAGWVDMAAYLAWRDAQGLPIDLALR
jgi:RHS repeat-associated protein